MRGRDRDRTDSRRESYLLAPWASRGRTSGPDALVVPLRYRAILAKTPGSLPKWTPASRIPEVNRQTSAASTPPAGQHDGRRRLAWLWPLIPLVLLAVAVFVLDRELKHLHMREILAHLHAIPGTAVAAAFALTAASYWVLGFYDVLALHYLRKPVPYARKLFTAFIAYALSHNFSLAAFTGAAVRLRMYSANGLAGLEIATISGFCSLTTGIGLALLAGIAMVAEPTHVAAALHLHQTGAELVGAALLLTVIAYVVWAALSRESIEVRGWSLRPPGATTALLQIGLGAVDLALSAAVLWALLPADAQVHLLAFVGVYVVAVTAGLISNVPGGLGVFETVIVLCLPGIQTGSLLGALLAYRGIYYLSPLLVATVLFLGKELLMQRRRLHSARNLASAWVAPLIPPVVGALTFLAGAALLLSGATPAEGSRLSMLNHLLPLPVVELSHLAGSIMGLGLLVLARSLLRRVHAAYHIAFWLLVGGMVASLLKGLDFEEAAFLGLVLLALHLGRAAFYRPAPILAQRFTPAWAASVVGVVAFSIWIGFISHRHVEYASDLWWTFALNADAPRMLRASLVVAALAAGYLLLNLLGPARPAEQRAEAVDLERARGVLSRATGTLGNAVLTGDKQLLFGADDRAFIMYQVMRNSWIALGDPVGDRAQAEELAWRLRELSDRYGGQPVFYQATAEYLPLYLDLGLAALKIGEEARVPLADFSLEGPLRAPLRQAHRRAERDGAQFEIVPAAEVAPLMPQLRAISDRWLEDKATAEKRFSVGAFTESYLQNFDIALIRSAGVPVAFANLWYDGARAELSIDLMRFDPDAPRGAMDYLFIELMLWGRAQGLRTFNLGMAPLAGLEQHPLAPIWHRVGNFIFRHGEHFYNFTGLRRYKEKFDPVWESRYLVARGGLGLPQTLFNVSKLIAGGTRELFSK